MKIYVGNLPFSISDDDLEELFSPFGAVTSAQIITTKYTGRSRGFGFVEMLQEYGQLAIAGLNGRRIGTMNLRVFEAREIRPRHASDLN